MSRLEVEIVRGHPAPSPAAFLASDDLVDPPPVRQDEWKVSATEVLARQYGPRRTPRKSLIVVLPDNHVVSPDIVTERLAAEGDNSDVDVILACAGQPPSLTTLQRRVRDLQILFAPAGTSTEDLRELAMTRAPGDIVTLLSGIPLQV